MLDGVWRVLADENGGKTATVADVRQSNGIIHVIDSVLLPKVIGLILWRRQFVTVCRLPMS